MGNPELAQYADFYADTTLWGAQIRFRLAVQAWVNSVDFAHPLRGWVRLTTNPQI